MGVGTGYSNNGTNYSYYPYFNYGTPEQNASNSIYQVRSNPPKDKVKAIMIMPWIL